MINIASTSNIAGRTATSHNMPCWARDDWVTALVSSKPTNASTKPGTTPPNAIPALKKMPVKALTMPAIRFPVEYSP